MGKNTVHIWNKFRHRSLNIHIWTLIGVQMVVILPQKFIAR